ncbi:hypothetical protein ABZ570_33870 [Micromonospora sp. NPDC007271]|uniref:hypothetical protein n=1 Tax=Micromonospora sp. NPDC007271 TaxID=3154587 RepID=UPI00341174CF
MFPDGDFYAFLTEDMTEGTFGHVHLRSPPDAKAGISAQQLVAGQAITEVNW